MNAVDADRADRADPAAPERSREAIARRLTGAGGAFEIVHEDVRGERMLSVVDLAAGY